MRRAELAMVDVELFVSAGAPRAAFRQESTTDDSESFWSVDADMLRRAGWVVSDDGWQGPPRVGFVPQPHPYGLGPMWAGSSAWQAEFVVDGRTVSCAVDHEALSTHPRDECRPGPPLASASPWLWHIADEQTQVCGRSENPLEAATQVESLMRAAGADKFVPTSTKVAKPRGERERWKALDIDTRSSVVSRGMARTYRPKPNTA